MAHHRLDAGGVAEGSLRGQLREALGTIGQLRGTIDRLQPENEALRAQVAQLLDDNESMRDRVARLEAEQKADSSTGKPPSSDPIGPRKKRAERRAEARAEKRCQGERPGAPGANLVRREPNVVVPRKPPRRQSCGALSWAEVVRQVIDLPAVKPVVTDHVSYRLRRTCGCETFADFPPEARTPVCFGPEVRAFTTDLLGRQHLIYQMSGHGTSQADLGMVQADVAGDREVGPREGRP